MEAKKRTVSKRVTTVLMLALAAALCLSLVACGKSDEDVVREGVTKELEELKNLDDATLDLLIGSAAANFEASGIDSKEFFRAWLDGFDYSVDKVSVNGNTATASVTITCKQMGDIMEKFEASRSGLTQEERAEQDGSLLMSATRETSKKTTSIDLPCIKNGNTWNLSPASMTELNKALEGSK